MTVKPNRNLSADSAYAAEAIAEALAKIGLPASACGEVLPYVRNGTPYVTWGRMRADHAERVAEILIKHAESVES
ncbi:hypothetical protein [Streptomyces caeruleatus]|uniref:hypothetical protein n=1 Tax=Streptomyces caeruleatus TaxID=661399 RepID=UPI000ABC8E1D|nr:hypothetical protein [Streptomyces caeruleatus]